MEEKEKKALNKSNQIKQKRKRKVSLITVFLWLFLIAIMSVITLNSTKKKSALEIVDNSWNIGLVMYDRSSDTPTTAITDFTWNATESSEEKELVMQINYNCTTGKAYQPGEIVIEVDGIDKESFSESNRSNYSYNDFLNNYVKISADKVSDINKENDWSYNYDEGNNKYTFINNYIVEENEHFEGTIQVLYILEPEFKIQTDLSFRAKLKENIVNVDEIIAMESNICNFYYTSEKSIYNLENEAVAAPRKDFSKIESILDDYYWVEYHYSCNKLSGVIIAYGENNNYILNGTTFRTTLQDGCILYDYNLNKIEPNEGNSYYLYNSSHVYENKYIVGYPKDSYSEGYKITNTVQIWGRYEDENDMNKLAEKSSSVSLMNFNFEYTGKLYDIKKSIRSDYNVSSIKNGGEYNIWYINVIAMYQNSKFDVEIGDDLLYITRENDEITRLNDNEYNFMQINIPEFYTYNEYTKKEGEVLIGYHYEIYVRYLDKNEWELYTEDITTNKIGSSNYQKNLNFERNDVVGVKVVIKDLDKSLYSSSLNNAVAPVINIHTNNFKIGKLYNFGYLQVYNKDDKGNRILVNEPSIESYSSEATKFKIAEYDKNIYGKYMQRACAVSNIENGSITLNNSKSPYKILNNKYEEQYEVEYQLRNELYLYNIAINNGCIIKMYDILPNGMELAKNKEEIIDSIEVTNYKELKLKNGTVFKTKEEVDNYIKENTTVDIDYNYRNSGRTKISIIYNLDEIDWSSYLNDIGNVYIDIDLNTKVPYANIAEYGTTYNNFLYSMWGKPKYGYLSSSIIDNGKYDILASDIDNNGDTEEKVVYSSSTLNLNYVGSSKQSVIKQVRTDLTKGTFVVGGAEASEGSEYTYKLKVTTGANSLKDLILYDTLETTYDENGNEVTEGWKGEFLGVDTSYAISKEYAPKVYYSKDKNPGKLTDVFNKWQELTDDVDKSTVKSICVDLRYKADGSEMELSSNNVIFVLINMKAPNNQSFLTSSSNMFSTNWKAKDINGTVIDNIDGIYSNKVNLDIYKENTQRQNIAGIKTWEDKNDSKYRPQSIIVKLLRDGQEYTKIRVTEDTNWEYEFKNVPIYKNEDLDKYEYTVEEEKVPYYKSVYDGYNIINILTNKDINAEKIWNDYDNQSKSRPKSIIVKLLQDGIEYMRMKVTEDENGKWKYSFKNLPIYKNDKLEEYEYTVEEEEVLDYETEYDGYNIINTLKRKDIEVTKIWDDNNNEKGLRPEYVLIKLFDGEIKIRESYIGEYSNWKCEFKNLPIYREDGTKIEYRIEEEVEKIIDRWFGGEHVYEINFETDEEFELYQKSYITQIVGSTVTNKYVDPDERIKITGAKVWEDEDNKALKRPDSVVLQLKSGDAVISEGVATKDSNWNVEFEVPRYDENKNEIKYYIDEKETTNFYEKELTDDYTVTNRFVVPDEKVKIEVIKLWEDLENKYEKRPDSITLQVLNGDNVVAEQMVDEGTNWRYEFELQKYDENGNEIEYVVNEKEDIEYYDKRVSGYTVINKCTYEPSEENIENDKKPNLPNTNDINIVMYCVIFIIAIIGFIVGRIFLRKNRK